MCFKSKEHLEADCHVKVFVPLRLFLAHLWLNSDIRYSLPGCVCLDLTRLQEKKMHLFP